MDFLPQQNRRVSGEKIDEPLAKTLEEIFATRTVDEWLPRREFDDYGDGHAAERILERLQAGLPR